MCKTMTGVVNRTSKEIIFPGGKAIKYFNGTEKSPVKKAQHLDFVADYRRSWHHSSEVLLRRFYSCLRRIVPYQNFGHRPRRTNRPNYIRIWEALRKSFENALQESLVLAGSIPIYMDIIDLQNKNYHIIMTRPGVS